MATTTKTTEGVRRLEEPQAYIVILDARESKIYLPIHESYFTIGRSVHNHLCLFQDTSVSRHHCVIRLVAQGMIVEDLNSRNGTFVNGHNIKEATLLFRPAWMMVGNTRLVLLPARCLKDEKAPFAEGVSIEDSFYVSSLLFEERVEALLVVDVVGSSRILQRGETNLFKVVATLGRMLARVLRTENEAFIKCTGDGFFACVSDANVALEAALKMAAGLERHISIPIQISTALHWGPVFLADDGERSGRNVHAVFSLEDLRHHNNAIRNYLTGERIHALILMTESYWRQLDVKRREHTSAVGSYVLKGLESEESIYRWNCELELEGDSDGAEEDSEPIVF